MLDWCHKRHNDLKSKVWQISEDDSSKQDAQSEFNKRKTHGDNNKTASIKDKLFVVNKMVKSAEGDVQ